MTEPTTDPTGHVQTVLCATYRDVIAVDYCSELVRKWRRAAARRDRMARKRTKGWA